MEEIDAAHYFKIIMVTQQGPKNRKKEFFRVWQISLLSVWILIMSIMNEKCMRKIWFLSFAFKIIMDYQIARVFNIEFLLDGLIVYFIFCMI